MLCPEPVLATIWILAEIVRGGKDVSSPLRMRRGRCGAQCNGSRGLFLSSRRMFLEIFDGIGCVSFFP
eukprot:COSAG06_NODE_44812_length_360_cov_0.785441_1_plen_67_part_10